jgi:hypothetical protein
MNSAIVITIGVSSRWYRNGRRIRAAVAVAPLGCPGGVDSGAAAEVGASDDTPAEAYVAIVEGDVSAFFADEVPSNRVGVR